MKITNLLLLGFASAALASCGAGGNNPGVEYAPDMYESVPYEPYKQTDASTINANGANLRVPAANTLPRVNGVSSAMPIELLPEYPIARDSFEYAGRILKNPIPLNEKTLAEGKYLYTAYCTPCHGEKGDGQGSVGKIYGGVPNYKASYIVNQPSGHIFHVITMGKNRMYPHGSQILPVDRWKIVHYVNQLREYKDVQLTSNN